MAKRDDLNAKVTWIPIDAVADVVPDELFDPDYMKPLFEYGYQRMISGDAWMNSKLE